MQIGAPRDYLENFNSKTFNDSIDISIPKASGSEQTPLKDSDYLGEPRTAPSTAKKSTKEEMKETKNKEPELKKSLPIDQYTPIKTLNTFIFEWKIKARITKKGEKKTWKNAKGSGTLLNIELIDSY